MRTRIHSVLLLATFFLTFAAPHLSQAQCEEEDFAVRETFPASGAADVPLNAFIEIRYPECYFQTTGQDPQESLEMRIRGELVPGHIEQGDDETLFFVPDALLSPNQLYDVTARDFEGDFPFSFRTSVRIDSEPPMFGEIENVGTAALFEPTNEAPDGGYRVEVTFAPATDDGAVGSVEYLLYLTRKEGLEAPELRARERNIAMGLISMAFVLTPEEAASPICIVVHAIDGLGQVDDDQQPRCFEPISGSFFVGCSIAPSGGMGAYWLPLLLGVVVVRRRRRHRRTR